MTWTKFKGSNFQQMFLLQCFLTEQIIYSIVESILRNSTHDFKVIPEPTISVLVPGT